MRLIAAVDRAWGLGCENRLLFHIRRDMERFRALTNGQVVVMGKNTLLSLPGGAPLKNRVNIVFTQKDAPLPAGALGVNGVAALLRLLQTPLCARKIPFVIGGAAIYELLLPYCAIAYITHVFAGRKADCALPRLSRLPNWRLAAKSPVYEEGGLRFLYAAYRNTAFVQEGIVL
ncbi:MAG: dihydrofolate reductase [Clostridiales bacterium]|jgi:dihydrofolate reductase|nr:dihydrofolate reductase [Clostridiales bacterium]